MKKERKIQKFQDFTKEKYKNCEVLRNIPAPEGMHPGPKYWEVVCSCNIHFIATSATLRRHLSKDRLNCGCQRKSTKNSFVDLQKNIEEFVYIFGCFIKDTNTHMNNLA